MSKTPKKTKRSKAMYSKGWATRRANAAKLGTSVHKFEQAGVVKTGRDIAGRAAVAEHLGIARDQNGNWSVAESPGRGEIVGGADAQLVERARYG